MLVISPSRSGTGWRAWRDVTPQSGAVACLPDRRARHHDRLRAKGGIRPRGTGSRVLDSRELLRNSQRCDRERRQAAEFWGRPLLASFARGCNSSRSPLSCCRSSLPAPAEMPMGSGHRVRRAKRSKRARNSRQGMRARSRGETTRPWRVRALRRGMGSHWHVGLRSGRVLGSRGAERAVVA